MPRFFAYIRVSTARQGEGVSLLQQKDAILRYAERAQVSVVRWFEEKETAAKRGRAVFSEMLDLLRKGVAAGVIIHKIDRSARNLRDWADLGELIDHGIDVRFANESLDLQTRGGRLSADIQAVVAADFIRNLREETKKGLYGRLKQGLYPMPAPLGYLNCGRGKPKEPDPVKAPLLRTAFELYSTGRYNLNALAADMTRRGLRNRKDGLISRNGWSVILNNSFYMSVIRIRTSGRTFPGVHQALVTPALFKRVQEVLRGKVNARTVTHEFLFRRLLACGLCDYSLIGETQKEHVYYRCHTPTCPTTGVREERVDDAIVAKLLPLQFSTEERQYLEDRLHAMRTQWSDEADHRKEALALRHRQMADRLRRLTDAYLEGDIDKRLFEERKAMLLAERQEVEASLVGGNEKDRPTSERLAIFLELAGNAYLAYKNGDSREKRELLGIVTSNRQVQGKTLAISLVSPFQQVADRFQNANGRAKRYSPRIWDALLASIGRWMMNGPEAEKIIVAARKKDNKLAGSRKGWRVAA